MDGGLRVETSVDCQFNIVELPHALAETLVMNESCEAGTFVLDMESGRSSHRFNLYCCDRDTVSIYTIMFALSAGKTIYGERFDELFGEQTKSQGHRRDPMIL